MGTLWLTTASLLLLSSTCVLSFSSSSFNSRSVRPSHDLGPKEMKTLLGQPVTRMRMVERPLEMPGGDKIKDLVSHSGVEVVTEDGRHFLIHKGDGFGGGNKGGNTVVVDVKHMSNKWSPVSNWKVPNKKTRVTDMVKAGGKDYNALLANCHDASKNVMYGDKKTDLKPVYLKPQVPEEDRVRSRLGHDGRTGGSRRRGTIEGARGYHIRTGNWGRRR